MQWQDTYFVPAPEHVPAASILAPRRLSMFPPIVLAPRLRVQSYSFGTENSGCRGSVSRSINDRNATVWAPLPPGNGAKNPIDTEFGSMLEYSQLS
jgi:hypothetical protein